MLRPVQVVSGSIANTMAEALCSQHGRVRHVRLAQPMSALSLKRTFISQLLTTSGFHHKTGAKSRVLTPPCPGVASPNR